MPTPSEINLVNTPRRSQCLDDLFSLSTLQSSFWTEVERQSALRGQPNVSPFYGEVARSVFDAGLWALRDKQSDIPRPPHPGRLDRFRKIECGSLPCVGPAQGWSIYLSALHLPRCPSGR